MIVKHSLRSPFYFHHVLRILRVGVALQWPQERSRFFESTLLLAGTVSVVASTPSELMRLSGAASVPEFLIFFFF